MLFDAAPLTSPREEAARWLKIALVIVGAMLLIPAGLFAAFWAYSLATDVPSKIVDFHPSQFSAKADRRFFYSIGNDLKNSNEIATNAPTLLRGKFGDFLVSPDETKIALVANGHLWVIERDGSIVKEIAPVDSIYREPKPIGQSFFRDDHFQWTRDSSSIYLIRDEYYASTGSQLYSEKSELWRYNLGNGRLEVVLKPFRGYECFFGLRGIYFSVPTQEGDLQLQYFDGTRVSEIGPVGAFSIPVDQLQKDFVESPFFSFSTVYFENAYFAGKGLALKTDEKAATQSLEINGRNFLTFTQGNGFKGHYYCSELQKSRLLPGDRYLVVETSCENFEGMLMIDTQSGSYEELPKNTRILTTLNTISHPVFRVTSSGMMDW